MSNQFETVLRLTNDKVYDGYDLLKVAAVLNVFCNDKEYENFFRDFYSSRHQMRFICNTNQLPGPSEVLTKVISDSLCKSNIKALDENRNMNDFGHEIDNMEIFKEQNDVFDYVYYHAPSDQMLNCQVRLHLMYFCEDSSLEMLNNIVFPYESLTRSYLEHFAKASDSTFEKRIVPRNFENSIGEMKSFFWKVPVTFLLKRKHLFKELEECVDTETVYGHLGEFPWDFEVLSENGGSPKLALYLAKSGKLPIKLLVNNMRGISLDFSKKLILEDIIANMNPKVEGFEGAYKELSSLYLSLDYDMEKKISARDTAQIVCNFVTSLYGKYSFVLN